MALRMWVACAAFMAHRILVAHTALHGIRNMGSMCCNWWHMGGMCCKWWNTEHGWHVVYLLYKTQNK